MNRLIFYLWEDNGRMINIYLKILVEIIYKMNYALELLIPSSLKEEFYTRFIIWAKEHNYIIFSNKIDSMSSLGYFIPQSYKDFYYE